MDLSRITGINNNTIAKLETVERNKHNELFLKN